MFTGIVEKTVEVLGFDLIESGARLSLPLAFEGLSLGDSIAVNGCCLTISSFEDEKMVFDLLTQTMNVTSLGDLKAGAYVNVERAMALGMRLGGHIVQGHVDGVGMLRAMEKVGQDHRLEVEIPSHLTAYCIDKGSLTLNGVSLTIAKMSSNVLEFWITPHTWIATQLCYAKLGDRMNVEVDVLAKYVERLLSEGRIPHSQPSA